jgi:hypothetical protein
MVDPRFISQLNVPISTINADKPALVASRHDVGNKLPHISTQIGRAFAPVNLKTAVLPTTIKRLSALFLSVAFFLYHRNSPE